MLTRETVELAAHELDELCRDEYGYGIVDLLADPNEELAGYRLRRLTGITLKAPFAAAKPIGKGYTASGARRTWTWATGMSAGVVPNVDNPNFEVLDQLRENLPRLDPSYSGRSPTWNDLLDEADHESGLFQVLVRWVDDKLHGRDMQSFASYYAGETNSRLGTIADITETVFNYYTAPVLASFIPGVGLVVPLVLIGMRFGLTEMMRAKISNEHDNSD